MNKMFYSKLAIDSIRKNRKLYVPYIITCIFSVAVFYIMSSLSVNEGLAGLPGSAAITTCMNMGCWVAAIFSLIFLFYTNSFLIKQRKKEFGVFQVLGMERRHIGRMVLLESFYTFLISLIGGLGIGIALDKVMYLLILRVLGFGVSMGFFISFSSMAIACVLFASIFFLIFLHALWQIYHVKAIDLLHSKQTGEREPKAKWLLALIGTGCLIGGYTLSLTTKNPIAALSNFLIAVLLVMAGTYLLFTTGSIVILKILRKNKGYYYKSRHFISVSGMLYRMKQNAVGLANICILSTMVLVMLSTTTSMLVGMEDILLSRYPYEINIELRDTSPKAEEEIRTITMQTIAKNHLTVTREESYQHLEFTALQEGDHFSFDTSKMDLTTADQVNILFFITLDDYNRITGENRTLASNEIILYSNREAYTPDTLTLMDRRYTIVERPKEFFDNGVNASNITSTHFIVVSDQAEFDAIDQLQQSMYADHKSLPTFMLGIDIEGSDDDKIALYNQLVSAFENDEYSQLVECRTEAKGSFITLYGGLFFLGIFLGTLFLLATILIIYYKQISEGYDDRERFHIMQKVGMSHREVKQSIHSQILTVFFLPLLAAGVHIGFAFPVISKLLSLMNLQNTQLFLLCTVICFGVFALLYTLVYLLTAKVYTRIVSR